MGPRSSSESALKGKTILVVEDEPLVRELEAQILGSRGVQVLQSGCVAEAVKVAVATAPIHLLLTDFSLPDRNGLDLAYRFRELHPQAAILLVSGSVAELGGRADGLDRFAMMQKPFGPGELLRMVQALLAGTPPPAQPGYPAPLSIRR